MNFSLNQMTDERVVEIQKGVDEIHYTLTAKNVIALPGLSNNAY